MYGQTNITTQYCYDGDQVIAEYEDGTLVRKFIYGRRIDEPIIMIDASDSDKYYYYHFDGLGSVVALSDDTGQIIETYEYDVFGSTTIWDVANTEIVESSIVGNPYMFTGRRYDYETGLYYYRARMYAPYIGRFMQTDPVGYTAGLNLYTYCVNNPLNWIDPWGLCKDDDDDDWWNLVGQFIGEFLEGTAQGMDLLANAFTFGVYDRLGLTNTEAIIREHGAVGTAANWSARVSATAPYSALGAKASGWNARAGIHGPHHGQSTHFQINVWKAGVKGSGRRWSFP